MRRGGETSLRPALGVVSKHLDEERSDAAGGRKSLLEGAPRVFGGDKNSASAPGRNATRTTYLNVSTKLLPGGILRSDGLQKNSKRQ